jgi:KaiC/GvpD/RAD55 family RecA-like ATPase
MNDLRIANASIPVLDSLLGGGFLSNSIIVISHWPGVKILELDYQLLSNNFDENTYLIVVTFHFSLQENIGRVKVTLQKSEFFKNVMELISSGRLIVIDCFSIPDREEDSQKGNTHYVSNPFNVDNLLSVMAHIRESVPENKRVVWFFFNLTVMGIGVPETELVKFCWRAFRYHKQHGDQAIYTFNEKAHTDTFIAKMYQLSDVFIKLTAEETSHGLKNGVQVIKGIFPFQSKKVFYEVNENAELQFTTNKLESKPETPTSKFLSTSFSESEEAGWGNSRFIRTGVPELNSLLGGGILSNSIIAFSYQYGVRIIEPLIHIFQNQFSEKNHIILINYHYSPLEFETRLEMWKQMSEIHKGPAQSLFYGNMSFIDCFGSFSETDTSRSNIYSVFNPFDVDKLLSVMTNVRSNISEEKSVFWLFHSLTDMSIGVPEEEVLKFCRRAFRYHKWCGDLAAYTMNEQAHTEMFRAKFYQLSDVFIKFVGEHTDKGVDTSIQILKGIFNWDPKKSKYLLDEKGYIHFVND